MCCFCLHFSEFNVLFYKKIVAIYFKKKSCTAKREKIITCRQQKSQPPLYIKWSVPNGYALSHNWSIIKQTYM